MEKSSQKAQQKVSIQSVALCMALIVSMTTAPATAMDLNAVIRKCVTAFTGFKKPSKAEVVFEKASNEWEALDLKENPTRTDKLTVIVRAAVNELASHHDWNQKEKAQFFRDIGTLIRFRAQLYFISDEFQGLDGSILFQGGLHGVALVIGPNGEVYRGNIKPPLNIQGKPTPLWNADYSNFRVIEPKLN